VEWVMHIVYFALVKKQNVKLFEEEVHPSEYEIEPSSGLYKITACFLKRDMTSDELNNKLLKLQKIIEGDDIYPKKMIPELTKNLTERYYDNIRLIIKLKSILQDAPKI
jgi:arginine decarboxylase-like protein